MELKNSIAETGISLNDLRRKKRKLRVHFDLKIKVEGGKFPLPLDEIYKAKSLSNIQALIKESLKDTFGYEKPIYYSVDGGAK